MSEYRVIKEGKPIQRSYAYFGLKSPDEVYYLMASIFTAGKGMGTTQKDRPRWPFLVSAGADRLSVKAGKDPGQKPDVAHFFLDNIIKP